MPYTTIIGKGIEFTPDKGHPTKTHLLCMQGGKPWLCYKHADGQWVTLREASDRDVQDVLKITGRDPRHG